MPGFCGRHWQQGGTVPYKVNLQWREALGRLAQDDLLSPSPLTPLSRTACNYQGYSIWV
jgi:hypothetical protein